MQQLGDDIIEEINVHPDDYHKFIWIPHRPVVKTEANTTTKIRPVINCSLKVNKAPSLNETTYAGVNLMKDIVKLSIYFRSNKFTMLNNFKQTFLQIRLAKEADKNRFCFFMRVGNRLVTYRYKTIIFGFNTSPFILNYALKHHAEKYTSDEFSKILRENMYVDNMLVTSNNLEFLKEVYQETQKKLKEGGFTQRSWNSNSKELQSVMTNQGNLASHGNSYEKVLGMKYMLEFDTLQESTGPEYVSTCLHGAVNLVPKQDLQNAETRPSQYTQGHSKTFPQGHCKQECNTGTPAPRETGLVTGFGWPHGTRKTTWFSLGRC
ncbi:uncharacterized protein LOC135203073 [Macrobrachium nipponense]|uniref:uncharacterized protein LOC135203073 n=1 Tax=Macrobrachium nipponense TaxID=159736 RepID=UPI0030C8381D